MNTSTLLQENAFDSLVAELSYKLRPLAWRYSQAFIDLDMDDFLAIGLEGAALVSQETGNTDQAYLYGVARNQMRYAFGSRTQKDIPSFSLDRYLYNRDTDRERYIAEDIITDTPQASTAIKARVARLLATLPVKHQQLLMARYQIEDATGDIPTVDQVRERYNLTSSNFNDTCNRALVMCLRNSQRQEVVA